MLTMEERRKVRREKRVKGIAWLIKGKEIIFTIKLAATAIRILVRGPARETSAKSFLPSFKLNGSTGTGLAAPNITGEPDNINKSGKSILI